MRVGIVTQVVCQRPGGRLAPDALGARRARPRDVRARQAGQGPAGAAWSGSPTRSGTSPGVTEGSEADIPVDEYLAWAERQPSSTPCSATRTTSSTRSRALRARRRADDRPLRLGELRPRGRRAGEAPPTTSSTRSPAPSRSATATLGIESPLLTWGCHPELIEVADGRSSATADDGQVRRPGQLHGQAQAVPGDRRGVHPGQGRPPAPADPRPGRPQGRQAREGGRRRPAGRDRARGPADRRAPAPVRGLPRLPVALALGGAGAAALRGDGLRDADDHQRLAADERGRHRRRQRDLRRLGALGRGRLGDPRVRPRLRPADGGDRAPRRRRRARAPRRRARSRCARASAAGSARSRASRGCSSG